MTDWKVGDKILVRSMNQPEPKEIEITRVARKYFYATLWGREVKFSIEGGVEPSQYPGSAYSAYTPEQWADNELRATLVGEFREEWGPAAVPRWVSTAALADIVEIVRSEKAAHG